MKALDRVQTAAEIAPYCAPTIACSYDFVAEKFGPEQMSAAACFEKTQEGLVKATAEYGGIITEMNPTPVSEKCDGDTGTVVFSVTGCMATHNTCLPGTTSTSDIVGTYTFDAADKVIAIYSTVTDAAAFFLSAKKSAARQEAMPVAGILITTFLLSALSIGSYKLGKKHGQASVSGGYTSLIDA